MYEYIGLQRKRLQRWSDGEKGHEVEAEQWWRSRWTAWTERSSTLLTRDRWKERMGEFWRGKRDVEANKGKEKLG